MGGSARGRNIPRASCVRACICTTSSPAMSFPASNDVVLNQVLVYFGDDETTTRVIDTIQAEGTCWCGGALDVERSLEAMLAIAATHVRAPRA